jgi:hypothetical protein
VTPKFSQPALWVRCARNRDWEVSRFGQVRRFDDHSLVGVRIINGSNERQYRAVQYRKPNTRSKLSVPIAHLVLEAFGFQRPSSKHVVLHKDGDLTNDFLDNLQWVTRSESARLATDLRYGQSAAAKVRGRGGKSDVPDSVAHQVCQAISDGNQTYELIAEALGVSKQFVAQIASGHRRANIAAQYGLLDDSPNLVRFAWPYLSKTDRIRIAQIAKRALADGSNPKS